MPFTLQCNVAWLIVKYEKQLEHGFGQSVFIDVLKHNQCVVQEMLNILLHQ